MNKTTVSLLLAGTALITASAFYPQVGAANEQPLVVAQGGAQQRDDDRGRPAARERQQQAPQQQRERQAPPAAQSRPQPPAAQAPVVRPQQRSAQPQEISPSRTQSAQQQPGAGRERDERPQTGQQQRPGQHQLPAAQQQQQQQMDQRRQQPAQTQPTEQQRRQQPAQTEQERRQQPAQTQPTEQQRRQQPAQTQPTEQQRPGQHQLPAAQQQQQQQQMDQRRQQPAQTEQDRRQQPAQTQPTDQQRRQQPAQTEQDRRQQPAQTQQPAQQQQQAQPRNANEFIRRGDAGPTRRLDDLRRERREERVGNQVVIREGDRTIIREGNRTVIRHDEGARFAIGARGVNVQRVGGETRTVVQRPDGSRIVTITDANGRLVRRIRQVNGRDYVIIDNRIRRPGYQMFVVLPPPVIRIPRERYIVDYRVGVAAPLIYETLAAEPVEPIAERYTLEQVRFSEPLRARMPRVDLDINFETGSWQLTPDQVAKLEVVASGIMRAVQANPQEVFLVEGHTDAVGNEDDNLSLSDRRAEAVAVALTEQFQVPPENLTTQGYGEQYLKVDTQGPSEENRRVSVRRVTPLLAQEEGTTGGGGQPPQ